MNQLVLLTIKVVNIITFIQALCGFFFTINFLSTRLMMVRIYLDFFSMKMIIITLVISIVIKIIYFLLIGMKKNVYYEKILLDKQFFYGSVFFFEVFIIMYMFTGLVFLIMFALLSIVNISLVLATIYSINKQKSTPSG